MKVLLWGGVITRFRFVFGDFGESQGSGVCSRLSAIRKWEWFHFCD